MRKFKTCPECGETLYSEHWTTGRRLQQRCGVCGWEGESHVPKTIPLKDTKEVRVGQFPGFHYETFDKYGHALTISRYYSTRDEAVKELQDDLARDNNQPDLSPCTGILWPSAVTVKGEMRK